MVVKLEQANGKVHTLEHEFDVYTALKGGIGIPHAHWFGTEAGFDAIAVDRLGQSLDDLFVQCHYKFTMKTVLLLAKQMVSEFGLRDYNR